MKRVVLAATRVPAEGAGFGVVSLGECRDAAI